MELKWVWIFTLVGIVFLAGCIQLPGGAPTAKAGVASGVIVKSFLPDVGEIYSGEPISFTLEVENVGESAATNVRATIYGLGDEWKDECSSKKTQTVDTGTLERAIPEIKAPGGFGTVVWTCSSPTVKVDTNYVAMARVTYTYTTNVTASIRVYNSTYLKLLPRKEMETIYKTPAVGSIRISKAPVTVSFAGPAATRALVDGSGKQGSLTVLISNVGQGSPYLGTNMKVPKVKIDNISIEGVEGEKCEPSGEITLPVSGQRPITCTFNLPSVTEFKDFQFTLQLSYNYFIDTSTPIKVLKPPTV
jgi:hypothetical protein